MINVGILELRILNSMCDDYEPFFIIEGEILLYRDNKATKQEIVKSLVVLIRHNYAECYNDNFNKIRNLDNVKFDSGYANYFKITKKGMMVLNDKDVSEEIFNV